MVDLKPISKVVLPVLILNWIFGVGMIQYPLGHPHPVISFIYSLTCTVVYCILAGLTYPDIIGEYNVTDSKIPVKIIFYSNIILTIATIALGWFRSEGMQKCLTMAAVSDVKMEKIGIPINYMKMLRAQIPKIIAALVFSCLILMTILLSQTTPLAMRVLPTIVLGVPVIITLISNATFIGLLSTASYRFQSLNQLLKSMLTTAVDYPQHKRIADRISEQRILSINDIAITDKSALKNQAAFIKSAKEIHLLLVRLCREGNNIYTIQLLLTIAVAFGVITGHLYNIYSVLYNSYVSKERINKIIFSSGVWIIFYITKICIITWASNSCENNAIKTGDLINEYYDEPWISTDTKSEIRDFNIQLIQRPLKFSAAGCVNVDLSLIQVMVATITTYLVILIQLGNFPKVATSL